MGIPANGVPAACLGWWTGSSPAQGSPPRLALDVQSSPHRDATLGGMDEGEEGRLLADVHDAAAALDEARVRLHQTVLAATRAGVRQRAIADASGYTREHLRRLARADGIGPAERSRTAS